MDLTGGFYLPERTITPVPTPPVDNVDHASSAGGDNAATSGDATLEAGQHDHAHAQPPTTLDQELASVMKGLGSFWGKVRKQSMTAYQQAEKQIDQYATSARKDLTPLVSKARANLDHLSESTRAELARLSDAGAASAASGVMIGADGTPVVVDPVVSPTSADEPLTKLDKGKGVDPAERGGVDNDGKSVMSEASAAAATPAAAAAAFFTKMQAQLASNPNVEELSKNFQKSLSSVQTNLSALPASLQTNLHQIQAQTLKHIDTKAAESYLHKGETWLSEFSHEVQRLAKDAVRVVPPGEETNAREHVVIGRKDTLIFRLRNNLDILLVDPAQPPPLAAKGAGEATLTAVPDTREPFSRFLQTIEDSGGLEGDAFKKQIEDELDASLKNAFAAIVPSKLTAEAFWTRYFFRKSQIEEEEQKRKAVLKDAAVTAANDEDFSWDMEDEEEAPATIEAKPRTPEPPSAVTSSQVLEGDAPPTAAPPTPKPDCHSPVRSSDEDRRTSPRASSDGASSYDVVGLMSGTPSEGEPELVSPAMEPRARMELPPTASESDEDSDWE